MEQEEDRLYLTFSAEEIGRIAVMIIKGVERRAGADQGNISGSSPKPGSSPIPAHTT